MCIMNYFLFFGNSVNYHSQEKLNTCVTHGTTLRGLLPSYVTWIGKQVVIVVTNTKTPE